MPTILFGDLRIVTSFDSGGLNPPSSAQVIYHRSVFRALLPLLPGLVLLPLLVLKPNRKFGAWLILIPFGLIAAAFSAGQQISALQMGEAFSYLYPYAIMLACSLSIVSLMTYAVPKWSFPKKILLVPALAVLPAVIILVVTLGVDGTREIALLVVYSIAAPILLLSATLAGRRCRNHWTLPRFSLLFCMWNLILVSVCIIAVAAVRFIFVPAELNLIVPVIIFCVMGALLLSLIAYPFVLAEFFLPTYRERLKAVFRAGDQTISI